MSLFTEYEFSKLVKRYKYDRWILETDVYKLEYYIGLAEEIDIIDAPGLKECAEAYYKKIQFSLNSFFYVNLLNGYIHRTGKESTSLNFNY